MTDLVERLNNFEWRTTAPFVMRILTEEAATRIQELEREVTELRHKYVILND